MKHTFLLTKKKKFEIEIEFFFKIEAFLFKNM